MVYLSDSFHPIVPGMLSIGIAGINGQMGREITAAVEQKPGARVRGGVVRPGSAQISTRGDLMVTSDANELLPFVDVLIDVSTPAASTDIARCSAATGTPLLCAVTGLDTEAMQALQDAATRIPVFYARNLSIGIAAILQALPGLVATLEGADIEIIETHHRRKADSPSGTALAILEAIQSSQGGEPVFGRRGSSPRTTGEVGIHSVRGGANSGEHEVLISTDGEEVRVSHRALNRRTFADGAIRACTWLVRQPPGFYGMRDLIE